MDRIKLDSGWRLRRHTGGAFRIGEPEAAASAGAEPWDNPLAIDHMPSQVHDVLIGHGVIEHPNIKGINHNTWIGESDWVYRCDFSVEDSAGQWTLRCEGLDTFADLYLNGEKIASANDVYLPCVVKGLSLQAENTLVLYFHSSVKVGAQTVIPEKYNGRVTVHGAFIRTLRSEFSDYNGPLPSIVRCGVYGDIVLERAGALGIEKCVVDVALNPSLNLGTVGIDCVFAGDGNAPRLVAELIDGDGNVVAKTESRERGSLALTLENPALWWPRTHGNPTVYRLVVTAYDGDALMDRLERSVGFRYLEANGNMEFRINNQPIRLWGANLVHMETTSGCYHPDRAEALFRLAENGNFNCLRIWAEGEVLPDAFYDEADRRGFLLWQDFFLYYAMYSEEPEFTALVCREVEHTVERLKHHPSILLWCSGNETPMGRDFDYPGEYGWGQDLYLKHFPAICKRLDPGRYYHISSPYGGRFANDPLTGDTHGYTHIWFVPGHRYPVFPSENNRVSTPPLRTMRRMMTEEELWPEGYTGQMTKKNRLAWPETWSGHNSNFGYLKVGDVENFYDADDAESMIYRLGAAHMLYFKKGVERYRQGRPWWNADAPRSTTGHLVWKFNNDSNIISYGIVDYFNEPSMAYYAVRAAYTPLLVSFSVEDNIHIWLTNDSPSA
jgi:beta-galactosidase/beta-glucuronidase